LLELRLGWSLSGVAIKVEVLNAWHKLVVGEARAYIFIPPSLNFI
jgi:hypothetical protein